MNQNGLFTTSFLNFFINLKNFSEKFQKIINSKLPNQSKPVQIGPNRTKPVQTSPNLRFCLIKKQSNPGLYLKRLWLVVLAFTKEEEEVSNSSCESDCFCPFSCVGTDLRPASVLHPSSTASAIISN